MTKTQQKVQLLVAGTGKQKEIYENLCTRFELSSRVTFLGKQSENQLAKLYERVTAVAYPSRGKLQEFVNSKMRHIARDKDGKLVFMAESKAWLQMVQDNFPEIHFHFTSEFKD